MRVLITGSAGRLGSTLVAGLGQEFELRGFDRVPTPGLEDAVVGDLADFDQVLAATRDMEAVIHVGANPSSAAPWEDVLHSNIIGTYNVFEAARRNGVRRVAFASRAGLLSAYPKSVRRTVDMTPRPNSYYSVSKLFGEGLGYMYSVRFGMEVVAVRIGTFRREPEPMPDPTWLSHRDAVQLFRRPITHPGVKYQVVFGVSDSNWPLYNIEHGRQAIGYCPQDHSEVTEQGWQP